jgi:hypothetical protein
MEWPSQVCNESVTCEKGNGSDDCPQWTDNRVLEVNTQSLRPSQALETIPKCRSILPTPSPRRHFAWR